MSEVVTSKLLALHLFLLACSLLVFAIFASDENLRAATVPATFASSLNTVCIFVLTFFIAQAFSKWNARFDNVCQTNGNVTRLSALAGAALSKKDAKTVMRYTNAVLHIYYLLNGSPDLTDETWEMLKNRGLLTSEEITKLKKQGSPGVVLYSWAIEAIQNAFAADPKGNLLGSHLLSSMEECIGGVRGLGAKQIAYSRTQIPFVYFHSVYLLGKSDVRWCPPLCC